MGASSSSIKSNVELLNETTIGISQKTFNEIQNTCNSTTNQRNVLNIIGSTVTKLNTNQKNVGKNICILQTALNTVQDTSAQNAMMSSIKSAIEQNSTAGIGLAVSHADSNIKSTNKFSANVSNETINRAITGCINNLDQSNVINIIGSNVTDSSLSQANDSFMECLSNNGASTQQTAAVKSDSTQEADTTSKQVTKGWDPLASLGQMYIAGIIACVICCLAIVVSSGMFALSPAGQSSVSQLSGKLADKL
jgi:hypothetical protein